MKKIAKTAFALLCASSVILASESSEPKFHLGVAASGSYIGIWHLDNEVFVKKDYDTDDAGNSTYKEQSLLGGHDLHGIGWSIGATALKDLAKNFQLHAELYLSLRYRFVDAKEHHSNETRYEDGTVDRTEGSKGSYDISLSYYHLDLPISLRYKLPRDFYVEAGAFVSYILSANLKIKLISLNFQSYAAGVELGLVGGIGKTLTIASNKKLELYSKFVFGLTPLLNDRVKDYLCETIYPREWLIQAGVAFYLF